MSRIMRIGVLLSLAVLCAPPILSAQERGDAALRRDVERRFEVLPLRDGIALRPRGASPVRSIEVAGGTIAIDGQPATGAEIRSKLGADADLVLQLSYLSDAARRALFSGQPGTPAAPSVPTPSVPTPSAPATPDIAPPAQPTAPPSSSRPRRSGRRNGDQVRIGRDVTVDEGEVISGDVVAVGGAVRVFGDVEGDVVAVGGSVTLGPRARVEGDVSVVGGQLNRDPGAQVSGRAQEVTLGGFELDRWQWRRGLPWAGSMLGSAFAFVGTIARVAVLCLLAALVLLFGRDHAERAGAMAVGAALKSGAIGLLAQVLFLPLLIITVVVLVVTIVGIPLLLLLPFAILALAIVGLIGFTGIAQRIGLFMTARLGWSSDNVYVVTIIGVLALMLPVLLARLVSLGGGVLFPLALVLGAAGFIIEYLAWTVGFGAVALTRFNKGVKV